MGKALFIAEKPSVAQEFAKVLKVGGARHDGYLEDGDRIVTWCVGHLITMSYPEVYDPSLKRWSLDTLPFLPDTFKYEVIDSVKKQFRIVSGLLNREDVETIYVCTDSGREGEYIYRLVEQMAGVKGKSRKRVWIDSQTEEEILKGIRTAKDLSAYDNLAASAYLRAKEDYLMGINFSRVLTLTYGNEISACLGRDRTVISVGRVMTCVLGMVVRREREIRNFKPTLFYRVLAKIAMENWTVEAEWRVTPDSAWFGTPFLYKENGFLQREKAEEMIRKLQAENDPLEALLAGLERKTEKKNAPLLYNLAELQNDCSRFFHISPDDTLKIVQELYEKKLVTYPRTDARVLSSAVAKEIDKNIRGLTGVSFARPFAEEVLSGEAYKKIGNTRYTDDKQITDHYAIIPTGQGLSALGRLSSLQKAVYEKIVRRFLSIFYPPAQYQKTSMEFTIGGKEHFFASIKVLKDPGYLKVASSPRKEAAQDPEEAGQTQPKTAQAQIAAGPSLSQPVPKDSGQPALSPAVPSSDPSDDGETVVRDDPAFRDYLSRLRQGKKFPVRELSVKEGTTSAPRRYTSGSMILAMENAGQLIEDEELRELIRGSGIGTSATRAEILKKLVTNQYLDLNSKTQVITPTLLGEVIYDVVYSSIRSLLNPDLTASWEKGLTYVAEGTLTPEEYMEKLKGFIIRRIDGVKNVRNSRYVRSFCDNAREFYKEKKTAVKRGETSSRRNYRPRKKAEN